MAKPILYLDFDGCIHAYSRGWQDGSIYDPVVPGFFEWAIRAKERFHLVIYSSRSKELNGVAEMKTWLGDQIRNEYENPTPIAVDDFDFAHEKPPAFLTIDDRALTFDGDWAALTPERLLAFKPWNAKEG
jgi:hypothetical protein